MFNQSKPFGQQPSFSGFGQTTPATPFGQTSFAPKPATTGFGATTPAFGSTTGTSLFAQNPQPSGSGLFGQPSQGAAFGQQPAQTGFGFPSTSSTGLFSQQPQQTTAPATGGLFGASTSSAFGQNKPSFGFGSTGTNTTLFGQPQAQQPQATSIFGQNNPAASTSLFGSTAGGFGQTSPQGTTIKFTPVTGTDSMVRNGSSQSISTRHNCITCMKEYENKSLEELRLEDYSANRKGPQGVGVGVGVGVGGGIFGPTQPTIGPFGAPSTSTAGGLFGTTTGTENKGLFGQPSTSIGFGSTPSAFGATPQTNTLFGKPTAGFGAPTTSSTSAFGFGANTTTQANPFGVNTQAKPFGAAATTQPTNLFGAPASQPTTAFGTTPSSGFGGFGAPQQNQSIGLFNQNKPAFSLGTSNSAFSFGPNTSTSATSGGLFGAKTAAPAFGTQTGFGATPSTGTSAFGTTFNAPTSQSSSLFGGTFNKPAGTGFSFGPTPSTNTSLGLNMGQSSLFGNTAQKPGGLFSGGSSTFGTTGLGTGSAFGTGMGTGTGLATGLSMGGTGLGLGGAPANQTAQLAQHQLLAMASVPFGDSPLFRNLLPSTGRTTENLQPTNPAAQKAVLSSTAQYKVSPRGNTKIKVKVGYPPLAKKSIFEGLEEDDGCMSQTFQARPNPKRLNITPSVSVNRSTTESASVNLTQRESEKENLSPRSPNAPSSADAGPTDWLRKPVEKPKAGSGGNARRSLNDDKMPSTSFCDDSAVDNTVTELRPQHRESQSSRREDDEHNSSLNLNTRSPNAGNDDKADNSNHSSSSSDDSQELEDSIPQLHDAESHPTGIICRRVGYYTIPPLDELTCLMSDDGSCIVENFTVGREGYGNVFYEGPFDVADLNLDEIVHFRHKEVVIYPDDEHKPPVGQGLNRRAQVTLDRVWPMDKTTHNPIMDPERLSQIDYESKLRRVCAKMSARFKDYRPQTGSWVFSVDHFSKYGMTDSDEEDGVASNATKGSAGPAVDVKKLKLGAAQDQVHQRLEMLSKTSPEQVKDSQKGLGGIALDTFMSKRSPYRSYEDHDMEERLPFDDSKLSKRASQMTSPMALLARETGTSAHKVQLMKSSFFMGGDDEDVVMSSYFDSPAIPYSGLGGVGDGTDCSEGSEEDVAHMAPILSKHGLFRSQFTGSEPSPQGNRMAVSTTLPSIEPAPGLLMSRIAGPVAAPVIDKPRTVILKHHGRVSTSKEVLSGSCLADMTLMRGASFRVGWGLNSTLLSLGTVSVSHSLMSMRGRHFKLTGGLQDLSLLFAGRNSSDTSARCLNRIKVSGGACMSPPAFQDSVEGHLQIQLRHSVAGMQGDCPIRAPSSGIAALHDHCKEAQRLKNIDNSELLTYHSLVWELCAALWGDLPDLEYTAGESNSHHSVMVRREAVSQWLESVAKPIIDQETAEVFSSIDSQASRDKEEHIKGILSLLSGRQLLEACQKAQDFGDHYCALLVSQLSGSAAVRKLMREQLTSWQESKADLFVSPHRLQLMLLVAGLPVLELSTSEDVVNTCYKLDWKRAFALHLWYMCSPIASIPDALQLYQEAFSASMEDSGNAYAKRPDPPYLNGLSDDTVETAHGRKLNDLCYHLLELYSERAHPLEQLLNPATHTSDPLDYRLSWCLMQVLESLGYTHLSPISAAIIHTSFASQLESQGLWHWAIFILLHLKDDLGRKSAVHEVLGRHVELLDTRVFTAEELFLQEKLHIPKEWIYRAKAIRASAMHRYADQAWYLIWASEWNDAHQVIMEHIAADAIINEQYTYLESLLRELEPFELSSTVSSWTNQGALLWDYLAVVKAVEDLLAVVASAPDGTRDHTASYKLERIQPQLNSLCARINNLPCRNAKDRLCQCEIAKRASTLVRNVTQLQRGDSAVWSQTLSHLVAQLPLPEDYAQQELQQLTNAYVT